MSGSITVEQPKFGERKANERPSSLSVRLYVDGTHLNAENIEHFQKIIEAFCNPPFIIEPVVYGLPDGKKPKKGNEILQIGDMFLSDVGAEIKSWNKSKRRNNRKCRNSGKLNGAGQREGDVPDRHSKNHSSKGQNNYDYPLDYPKFLRG